MMSSEAVCLELRQGPREAGLMNWNESWSQAGYCLSQPSDHTFQHSNSLFRLPKGMSYATLRASSRGHLY